MTGLELDQVDQLEKGTLIHADIDELKITVMDAMAQLTLSGDYGYGPLSGQVTALQGDAFDILAADEADCVAIGTVRGAKAWHSNRLDALPANFQ